MQQSNSPKVLIASPFYLPGYKAGGALRTVANMVDHLSDDFDFWIVTQDRDLGDTAPYPNIQPNQWQEVGGAMVYYLSPENCTVREMANLISSTPHDALYLNSFFNSDFTIKPLLARRLGWLPDKPVVIAPRGEFSAGAVKLKYLKKRVFIQVAKLFKLYSNVTWQASSEHEQQDIIRVMNAPPVAIHIALDLPAWANSNPPVHESVYIATDNTAVRIVFLSRISPMKNLDYALTILSKVKVNVIFDIYGPAEDGNYWKLCNDLIKQLPENVSVNYFGSVHPDQVAAIFSRYDLFFFPTHGENYGHVIAEALTVGTAVLLSDQTPWRDLQSERLGWDLPLDDMEQFVSIIETYSKMPSNERIEWRQHILTKIVARLAKPQVFEDNRDLFRRVMRK
jgi:glycosyltransferase involved in cell wall biosynthesis